MSGLGPSGFVSRRLPELLEQLDGALEQAFGPDLDTQTSVVSRLSGITAERLSEVWELLEILSWSRSPDGAAGARLDEVASLASISRGQPSQVEVVLRGTPGAVIPAGAELSAPGSAVRWALVAPVTLAPTPVVSWKVLIQQNLASTWYGLALNGTPRGFMTPAMAPTANSIASALGLVVNAAGLPMIALPTSGPALQIAMAWPGYSGTVAVATSPASAMVLTQGTAILGFGVGVARATTPGPVLAAAGTLTQPVTTLPGWEAVMNPMAAEPGSDDEPDAAFRLRWLRTVSAPASASLDAIRDALLALDGVSAVRLLENPSPNPVGARGPHSLEVVVEGGQDAEIAATLWQVRPAGIPLVNSIGQAVSVPVQDIAGGTHAVVFTRPAEIQALVEVYYRPHPEEDVPAATEDLLREAVVRQVAQLRTGEDLFVSRLLAVGYLVPGVYELQIRVSDGLSGLWHADKLKAGPADIIRLTLANTFVTPL